jgi:hypothetical protein
MNDQEHLNILANLKYDYMRLVYAGAEIPSWPDFIDREMLLILKKDWKDE